MRIPEKWSPVRAGLLARANRTRLTYSRNRKTIGGDSERGRRRSIGYSVAARADARYAYVSSDPPSPVAAATSESPADIATSAITLVRWAEESSAVSDSPISV